LSGETRDAVEEPLGVVTCALLLEQRRRQLDQVVD
jgi:hypothetical protein